jgi:hypothetical protein
MSNDERNPKSECRKILRGAGAGFVIWILSFFRIWSFVIRICVAGSWKAPSPLRPRIGSMNLRGLIVGGTGVSPGVSPVWRTHGRDARATIGGFMEGGRYCGLTVTRQKRIGAWPASDASSKRTRSQIVSIDEELISTPLDPAELQSRRSLLN